MGGIWRNEKRYEEKRNGTFSDRSAGHVPFPGRCTSKSEKKALEYKQLGISQMKEAKYEDAVSSFQKALDQSLGKDPCTGIGCVLLQGTGTVQIRRY